MSSVKCALIIDPDLPAGMIANTASILSMSIGKHAPEIVGQDMEDLDGTTHRGITTIAIPILAGEAATLRDLAARARELGEDVFIVDVTGATRRTRSYEDYCLDVGKTPGAEIDYQGIGVIGTKKAINKLTGNLKLLR